MCDEAFGCVVLAASSAVDAQVEQIVLAIFDTSTGATAAVVGIELTQVSSTQINSINENGEVYRPCRCYPCRIRFRFCPCLLWRPKQCCVERREESSSSILEPSSSCELNFHLIGKFKCGILSDLVLIHGLGFQS